MNKSLWVKGIISAVVILLALLRLVFFDFASKRMDSTFLLLLTIAVLIHVIPWDRLASFKAAGVEVVLDKPQIKGALESMGLNKIQNKQLWETLSQLLPDIERAKGSRILWIDDKPHEILGERRLLRALGIEVVTAKDSESAEKKLEEDNDFDLIISDMQRKGIIGERETIYDGVYFIKELREAQANPVIKSLPVIFYTAYRPEQIETVKSQTVISSLPGIEFCNSIESLLIRTIKILSEVRSNPITVTSKKKPTPAG